MANHILQTETTPKRVLTHEQMVGVDVRVGDLPRATGFYQRFFGQPPLQRTDQRASFDAGPSTLHLVPRPAGTAAPGRDRTVALTFLVSSVDAAVARLRAAGIEVGEPFRYEVGATADLHDPDGHWLSLYEASPAAMTWPSGSKIRALVDRIDEVPRLVYLFMFVPDAEEAYDFYAGTLGLSPLECRPCRRGSTDHPRGVVKYDAGGVMLTTHLVEEAHDPSASQWVRDRDLLAEVTPVFATEHLATTRAAIAAAGITGGANSFGDPFGRQFALIEEPAGTRQRISRGA